MTHAALETDLCDIVVDEVFPHAPRALWHALTTADLMGRWLMVPKGFAPEVGRRFTYQTTPAGPWDGVIECEVLEVTPFSRFAYSWKGGHAANSGYGSPLDTVVTFLIDPTEAGSRLRLVHSGFVLPTNRSAYEKMSDGWKGVVKTVGAIASEGPGGA